MRPHMFQMTCEILRMHYQVQMHPHSRGIKSDNTRKNVPKMIYEINIIDFKGMWKIPCVENDKRQMLNSQMSLKLCACTLRFGSRCGWHWLQPHAAKTGCRPRVGDRNVPRGSRTHASGAVAMLSHSWESFLAPTRALRAQLMESRYDRNSSLDACGNNHIKHKRIAHLRVDSWSSLSLKLLLGVIEVALQNSSLAAA